MYTDLAGKVALVTGCGKKTGIGYAIARKLASCGANVIIADLGVQIDEGLLKAPGLGEMEEIAGELAKEFSVKTIAVGVDVTSTESVKKMAETVKGAFDHVDILCNNAGATFGVPATVLDYNEELWLKTVDINLTGTWRVSRAIIPMMIGRAGSIINTSSRAGKVPPVFNGAYAVAKAGLNMLTKVMAKELAGAGIRVNAICPGQIYSDFEMKRFELEAKVFGVTVADREQEMCKTIPMGRIGKQDEVAGLVASLASSESSYITGQAVNVDGGQLMEL